MKYFKTKAAIAMFLIVCMTSIACSFLGMYPVAAEELKTTGNSGISVSPPMVELLAEKGKTYSQKIKVSNPSNTVIELYPISMNFTSDGEGGQPKFVAAESGDEKYSLATWIKVSQTNIAVAPQQIVEFEYVINVPRNAEPGGHYGVIFFSTQPQETSGSSTRVSISSMVGSLIMLSVDGAISESAMVQDFWFPKIIFSGALNISTKIANTGNIHLKPTGEVDITGILTSDKTSITFNSVRGNILPDSTRAFYDNWAFNKYKNIGPHRIDLKILYGEGGKSLNASRTVWILPWWLIITIFLIIVAIIIIIFSIKRRKRKDFKKYFKVPG